MGGRFEDFRQLLFSSKLRLNVQDGIGNTALHGAAAGDHPRLCHFILKTDPKVINVTNNIGDTALHKAAGRAKPKVIDLLLVNNADIMAKNNDGQRPQDIAKDPKIIEMLTHSQIILMMMIWTHLVTTAMMVQSFLIKSTSQYILKL